MLELEGDLRGVGRRYGVFRSSAKQVGPQSMMERSTSALIQAMCGVRSFGAVGQLCLDEVYSPVQAMLDRELVRYGTRLEAGIGGA